MDNINEKFYVEPHLVGLALGPKYCNLKMIKELKGITNVVFKNQMFEIQGYNEKAVAIARSLLEYSDKKVICEKPFSDSLLSNNGEKIKDIIHKSGLVRIEVSTNGSNFTTFILTGNGMSIVEAKTEIEILRLEYSKFSKTTKYSKYSKCETFSIPREWIGLAVGEKGHIVKGLQEKHDLLIEREESGSKFIEFHIYGNNLDGVNEAKKVLKIIEDKSIIVDDIKKIGKIIGKSGSTINEIRSISNVRKIIIPDKNTYTTNIPITIIGNAEEVELAKQCIQKYIC